MSGHFKSLRKRPNVLPLRHVQKEVQQIPLQHSKVACTELILRRETLDNI